VAQSRPVRRLSAECNRQEEDTDVCKEYVKFTFFLESLLTKSRNCCFIGGVSLDGGDLRATSSNVGIRKSIVWHAFTSGYDVSMVDLRFGRFLDEKSRR
jgi:hypothetical protein